MISLQLSLINFNTSSNIPPVLLAYYLLIQQILYYLRCGTYLITNVYDFQLLSITTKKSAPTLIYGQLFNNHSLTKRVINVILEVKYYFDCVPNYQIMIKCLKKDIINIHSNFFTLNLVIIYPILG